MVIFLLCFRVRRYESKRMGERLFTAMLVFTLAGLTAETASFLIDGRIFPGCYFLQYLTNTVCTGLTVTVGFLWCLYVDFRIFCSARRLRMKGLALGVPLLVIYGLLIVNLFGNGVVFAVDAGNRYVRGSVNLAVYIVLFFFFLESIVTVYHSKQKGISLFFFPAYYFVVPCMAGTVIQGLFYGLSVGWLATSVAFMFIYLELQTGNAYVDDTSGLFNRQYLNYYLARAARGKSSLHGIMLDVNGFKSINDCYGHSMGDRAILELGRILSEALLDNAIAMRMAGDEFVVLLSRGGAQCLDAQMQAIEDGITRFNSTGETPFRLSVSMGTASLTGEGTEAFLSQMDRSMYAAKREYYKRNPKA